MTKEPVQLHTPLGDEILTLRAGDRVELSGIVYTARDEAHLRMREQLRGRGVYFAFTGGCAALASSHMTLKGVFFEDLGMAEAVWVTELDHLPLVVGIDAHGNDIFEVTRKKAETVFKTYSDASCR